MAAEPAPVAATVLTRVTAPVVAAARRVDRDDVARRAEWFVWPVGLVLLVWAGRHQWFVRDDWAFLFTRDRFRETNGLQTMLLYPQDGHWMTWPILTFHALRAVFGITSYLPYLVVLWITHTGIVLLARTWMRRLGVSAWGTTLMTAVLFWFGSGWENTLFAVQIVYNFSLLAFLAQSLLVDHDGPVDRRDVFGSILALVGVSSSGFGPFFGFGITVLLVVRRRWAAACVAVVPQAVAWLWWWFNWGDDPAGDAGNTSLRFAASFTKFGIWSTFGSLTGSGILAWSALILCVAMIAWHRTTWTQRAPMIAFLATAFAMYLGIGARREIFGVYAAAWPRYQYMAAMLLAPGLALGMDQARRFAPWGKWVARLVLVLALGRNVVELRDGSRFWSAFAEADRRTFSLVVGSDERFDLPQDGWMTEVSPDVQVRDLERLVAAGAIEPAVPVTPEDQEILRRAIDQARATGSQPAP